MSRCWCCLCYTRDLPKKPVFSTQAQPRVAQLLADTGTASLCAWCCLFTTVFPLRCFPLPLLSPSCWQVRYGLPEPLFGHFAVGVLSYFQIALSPKSNFIALALRMVALVVKMLTCLFKLIFKGKNPQH